MLKKKPAQGCSKSHIYKEKLHFFSLSRVHSVLLLFGNIRLGEVM